MIKTKFRKSLKSIASINWEQTYVYQTYEVFRYDLPRFFKNLWYFRNEIYDFRWYDYRYNLSMFRKTLERTSDMIAVHGLEVDETRLLKVAAMQEATQIMKMIEDATFIDEAEKELGAIDYKPLEFKPSESHPGSFERVNTDTPEEMAHFKKILDRSNEIYIEKMDRLMIILRGQKTINDATKYDGTGITSWWD